MQIHAYTGRGEIKKKKELGKIELKIEVNY